MQRPEVRIIDQQQEEIKPADISQYEREMLLAKYGYKQPVQSYTEPQNPNSGLSFEEMCRLEDDKRNQEMARKMQQMYGPKPISFGGQSYTSETNYGTDTDSGLTFRVTIVSDMPIPK